MNADKNKDVLWLMTTDELYFMPFLQLTNVIAIEARQSQNNRMPSQLRRSRNEEGQGGANRKTKTFYV